MKKYLLGLYEKSMPNDLSLKDKLIAAYDAGFDFLEISIDESEWRLERLDWTKHKKRELAQMADDAGVKISSMCLSANRKAPLGSSVKEVELLGISILQKAIDFASDVGIRIIQIAGYDVYYGEESSQETRERFIENLKACVNLAASKGVMLGIETMETDFINTVEKTMYIIKRIDSPYLNAYPDIGNVTNGTDNAVNDIETGKGRIIAAHLKETIPNVFREVPYGRGRVDFVSCIETLYRLGTRRYLAEFWYNGKDDWRDTLNEAHAFLCDKLHKGITFAERT